MLAGALSADQYWTERVLLLPESTLSLLHGAMLEGVSDFRLIDSLQVGTFPLPEIVAGIDDVRSAPLP